VLVVGAAVLELLAWLKVVLLQALGLGLVLELRASAVVVEVQSIVVTVLGERGSCRASTVVARDAELEREEHIGCWPHRPSSCSALLVASPPAICCWGWPAAAQGSTTRLCGLSVGASWALPTGLALRLCLVASWLFLRSRNLLHEGGTKALSGPAAPALTAEHSNLCRLEGIIELLGSRESCHHAREGSGSTWCSKCKRNLPSGVCTYRHLSRF
jgi:hypothetical protein